MGVPVLRGHLLLNLEAVAEGDDGRPGRKVEVMGESDKADVPVTEGKRT